ncbi:MAG: hypothetical protein JWQ97_3802, partial [Phenylobacterium sp.]|nr:hypothetical protein [Phenylobacterium sp.]
MKPSPILLLAVAAALAAAGPTLADDECQGLPNAGAAQLTVETAGLRAAQGEVQVTVYPDNPGRFLAHRGKLA